MEIKKEKVIVIGGGPAGLSAAVYLSRASLYPLIIAGSPPGGQLMLTSDVENYPGIDSILGADLIQNLRKQTEKFGSKIIDQNVTRVDFNNPDNVSITLSNNKDLQSQAVLIATGASASWLGIESEKRLRGKGVSACATCDGFFYKDKVVAVIGGGDTAMEEALTMTKFASKVYIIHRRDEFRASQIMQERVFNNSKITILWDVEIEEIVGKEKVTGVKLIYKSDKAKKIVGSNILEVDGVFIAIGHKPNTEFLKNSSVHLDDKGYIKTSGIIAWEKMKNKNIEANISDYDFHYQYATNIKGVFAAGDVVDYIYRQASTAVGTGVAAALEVEKYLEMQE